MARSRKSATPRELVRLTPTQFSLSVSLVVLLAAVAALGGYWYGYRKGKRVQTPAAEISLPAADPAQAAQEATPPGQTVTFYSALPASGREPEARVTFPRTVPVPSSPTSPPAARADAPAAAGEGFRIQVASFPEAEQAEGFLAEMAKDGYSGTVVEADLGERGRWYRVRLGPFPDEAEARRVLARLKETRAVKGFVVR